MPYIAVGTQIYYTPDNSAVRQQAWQAGASTAATNYTPGYTTVSADVYTPVSAWGQATARAYYGNVAGYTPNRMVYNASEDDDAGGGGGIADVDPKDTDADGKPGHTFSLLDSHGGVTTVIVMPGETKTGMIEGETYTASVTADGTPSLNRPKKADSPTGPGGAPIVSNGGGGNDIDTDGDGIANANSTSHDYRAGEEIGRQSRQQEVDAAKAESERLADELKTKKRELTEALEEKKQAIADKDEAKKKHQDALLAWSQGTGSEAAVQQALALVAQKEQEAAAANEKASLLTAQVGELTNKVSILSQEANKLAEQNKELAAIAQKQKEQLQNAAPLADAIGPVASTERKPDGSVVIKKPDGSTATVVQTADAKGNATAQGALLTGAADLASLKEKSGAPSLLLPTKNWTFGIGTVGRDYEMVGANHNINIGRVWSGAAAYNEGGMFKYQNKDKTGTAREAGLTYSAFLGRANKPFENKDGSLQRGPWLTGAKLTSTVNLDIGNFGYQPGIGGFTPTQAIGKTLVPNNYTKIDKNPSPTAVSTDSGAYSSKLGTSNTYLKLDGTLPILDFKKYNNFDAPNQTALSASLKANGTLVAGMWVTDKNVTLTSSGVQKLVNENTLPSATTPSAPLLQDLNLKEYKNVFGLYRSNIFEYKAGLGGSVSYSVRKADKDAGVDLPSGNRLKSKSFNTYTLEGKYSREHAEYHGSDYISSAYTRQMSFYNHTSNQYDASFAFSWNKKPFVDKDGQVPVARENKRDIKLSYTYLDRSWTHTTPVFENAGISDNVYGEHLMDWKQHRFLLSSTFQRANGQVSFTPGVGMWWFDRVGRRPIEARSIIPNDPNGQYKIGLKDPEKTAKFNFMPVSAAFKYTSRDGNHAINLSTLYLWGTKGPEVDITAPNPADPANPLVVGKKRDNAFGLGRESQGVANFDLRATYTYRFGYKPRK